MLTAKDKAAYSQLKRQLKHKFRLDINDFFALLNEQKGLCAVCKAPIMITNKGYAVDHCHETGTIRGLLCNRCNLGLGLFKDNEDALLEAANYIVRHRTLVIRLLKR